MLLGRETCEPSGEATTPAQFYDEIANRFSRLCNLPYPFSASVDEHGTHRIRRYHICGLFSRENGMMLASADDILMFRDAPKPDVFSDLRLSSALRVLTEANVRKISTFFGKDVIPSADETYDGIRDLYETPISTEAAMKACSINEEETLATFEKLMSIKIISYHTEEGYRLNRMKMAYLEALFGAFKKMIACDIAWDCPKSDMARVGFSLE